MHNTNLASLHIAKARDSKQRNNTTRKRPWVQHLSASCKTGVFCSHFPGHYSRCMYVWKHSPEWTFIQLTFQCYIIHSVSWVVTSQDIKVHLLWLYNTTLIVLVLFLPCSLYHPFLFTVTLFFAVTFDLCTICHHELEDDSCFAWPSLR